MLLRFSSLFGAIVLLLALGCEARLALGRACVRGGECPAPLVCNAGRCRTECVEHRDCSLGARCVLDPTSGQGRCSLPDDPDCRLPGSACAPGLLCVVDRCVNSCETAATCPSGSVCVRDVERRAYCERDDADAGEALDASERDAPSSELDAALDGGSSGLDAPDAPCLVPSCDPVVEVAVVRSGSCALTERGAVWCWGREGALARGEAAPFCASAGTNCMPTPVRARLEHGGVTREIRGATLLSGTQMITVVEAGRAYSWGGVYRTLGAIGDGDLARAVRVEPGSAFLSPTVRFVDQGSTAAMAILDDGALFMWGDDDLAQRGAGLGPGSDFAAPADPLPGGASVALGGAHGCGIRAGAVWCWGENDFGQVGGPALGAVVLTATLVPGVPSGVTDVAPGRAQTCALVDGAPYCWGLGWALGNAVEPAGCVPAGGAGGRACPAVAVAWGGEPFVRLFTGGYSEDTCAITAAGELWCWGPVSGAEPTRSPVPPPVTAVGLGDLHSCAVTGGDVWCWGANVFGQLGRGFADAPTLAPAAVVWPE